MFNLNGNDWVSVTPFKFTLKDLLRDPGATRVILIVMKNREIFFELLCFVPRCEQI